MDMNRQNDREMGAAFEEKACAYLQQKGLMILDRNFHVRQGEIDIIARDCETIVFVEVKYRKNAAKGLPEEAVGIRKQRQICKIALFYLAFHRLPLSTPCRFDVVAICGEEIRWIQNAFPYIGI
jgi:putative endonuclease